MMAPQSITALRPRRYICGIFLLTFLFLSACSHYDETKSVGLLEWDRLELTAEANEPIVKIHVKEGQRVKRGQVLITLDTRRLTAQVDEAKAAMREAKARLDELKRGTRPELISEARSKLAGLRSELSNANREYARQRSLMKKKLTSVEVLDRSRAAHEQATAKYNAGKAELERLLAGNTEEELRQAEAKLEQTKARLRSLQVTLGRLSLTAPVDAVVDTLPYKTGESPSANAVIAVVLTHATPYARVYVSEKIRIRVKPGTKAELKIDGLKQTLSGHVRKISQDPVFTPYYSLTKYDRSRLSYVAEVDIDDPKATQLSSGVPVEVRFLLDKDSLK